jgi:tryptophanyl-tRNA synthetase
MFALKPFQETAVSNLKNEFLSLWKLPNHNIPLVFKSPTGSGKTIMLAQFLRDIVSDPRFEGNDVAFVWFSFSEDSYEQSKKKLFEYYGGASELDLIDLNDLSRGKLNKNNIFFINWQKIKGKTKDSRKLRRENEQGLTFDNLINETHEDGRKIVVIIDEEHRENIKKRLDGGKRVSLRELMYPLMQGYDSVAIKADVELGGTDQRFNLLAGRELQRHYNQEPQDIITNPLIEGLDGRKMSSSWGNTVNLLDSPNDMYGKVMSLKDEFIIKYFILTTRVDMTVIEQYKKALESGANPKDIKMKLAFELVRFYHSSQEAKKAEEYFINTFSKKEIPTDLPKFQPNRYDIISVLVETRLVLSRSEARRVIEQNGVKIDGTIINDIDYIVSSGSVLQKGKINFLQIL